MELCPKNQKIVFVKNVVFRLRNTKMKTASHYDHPLGGDGRFYASHFEPFCCLMLFEPLHDKTNKMACAPSEDSDQPGHPPSLIRVFAVRMKKAWVLSYPLSAQRRL